MRRVLVSITLLLAAGCVAVVVEEAEVHPSEEPPRKKRAPAIVVGPPVPHVIEAYRIKPLDILEVSVLGEDEMTKKTVVGPDGRLSYFVAADVVASGRTFGELRAAIRERLKEYFVDPQVCVVGLDFAGNSVSVLGQVRKPGTYVIGSETRLLDAIATAGGVGGPGWYASSAGATYGAMDFADLEGAFVLRKGKFVEADFRALFNGNAADCARNNILLQANDTVYIPSALSLENKVFVLGAVALPRVVRYGKEITLLEAIADCGGLRIGANYRQALVVRGSLKKPRVIPVDLNAVRTGSALDVKLEPGDIVYVPKTALKNFDEIVSLLLPTLSVLDTADLIYLRH